MCCVVRHTMQALLSGQMLNMQSLNRMTRAVLCTVALALFVAPAFGQGTAIEPCQATPASTKAGVVAGPQKSGVKTRRVEVNASVPDDPDVAKIIAPYRDRVVELSKVIGRLEGDLTKTSVGAGSLGNFVTVGMKAEARTKLGTPVTLTIMNA